MMRRLLLCSALALTAVAPIGCQTHVHHVGQGETTGLTTGGRQWYALWGLVRVNSVDAGAMARGAEDYTIRSKWGILDILLNIFSGMISFTSRTVTVTK